MRLAIAVPEAHVSPEVLDAGLEATTKLNENLLHDEQVPLFRDAVHRVRWKPEPPGDECFDHAKVVLGRGWGDCDDLATWHAASLRTSGEDPRAKAFVQKSGPNRWHAVVRRSDGSIDDPSREAGMGQTNGIMGAKLPLMAYGQTSGVNGTYVAMPQLAMRPVRNSSGQVEAWQARADLPWHWSTGRSPGDIAMASLHASPISDQSIAGACEGLIRLGEANDVEDDILDRAAAVRDLCDGADWADLADEYGEEHATAAGHLISGFFGLPFMPQNMQSPADAHAARMKNMGLNPDGTWFPHSTYTGREQFLAGVMIRYMRGEQPHEKGGRPPPRGFTQQDVDDAIMREKAAEATMPPDVRARRIAFFNNEKAKAHHARREARQFGNVLTKGLGTLASAAMPIAQSVLPLAVPGLGSLASAALHMASPMLQNLLAAGAHLPVLPGVPPGYGGQFSPQAAMQFASQMPGFISPFG